MSHAELRLSRQKVAHLETMPLFLGILNGEVVSRQVLGDSAATMLHGSILPCCETCSSQGTYMTSNSSTRQSPVRLPSHSHLRSRRVVTDISQSQETLRIQKLGCPSSTKLSFTY